MIRTDDAIHGDREESQSALSIMTVCGRLGGPYEDPLLLPMLRALHRGYARWSHRLCAPVADRVTTLVHGDMHLGNMIFEEQDGAASVASFLAAVLAGIYLCSVCSCQEILSRNGRG
jgi:hypothetical protein